MIDQAYWKGGESMFKLIRHKFNRSSSSQKVTLSFLLVIFLGSLLLSLNSFQVEGSPATYLDHLFMSLSMVCVNGLVVYDLHEIYNIWGQIVSLVLIQIGGLGIVTVIALTMNVLHKKISLKEQYTLQNALNRNTNIEFMPFLRSVYRFTFILEALGALIFMIDFIPLFGWKKGIFNSVFLSVSAFCNAGFVNFDANSLVNFKFQPNVYVPIMVLVIIGGIGFSVWFEIQERTLRYLTDRPRSLRLAFKRFSTHGQIVLISTAVLLVTGAWIFWLFERTNPLTLESFSLMDQLGHSFFHSTSLRTSGFSLLDYSYTYDVTLLFTMAFMLIGGSPGGTAGGIKVTSIAMILLLFRSELKGHQAVTYRKRSFPSSIVRKAFVITLFYIVLFIIGFVLLLITHPYLNTFHLMFETVAAISTTGLSMGITDNMSTWGHIILMVLMFIGRLGPITILMSIHPKPSKEIQYAKADIILG